MLYRNTPLSGSGGHESVLLKYALLKRLLLFPSSFSDLNVAGPWRINFTELEAKYFQNFTVQPRVNGKQRRGLRIKM
jgi:hypothetical protein